MTSFGTVRYASQFKPLSSKPRYVNSPGAGAYSLASLIGNRNPSATPSTSPAVSPNVTPATSATPSDSARSQVASAPKFAPPAPDSLATDPILMQIRDLGQRSIQDARSGALNAAENALTGYGSYDVPQTLKDLYAQDTSNPIYAALNDTGTAQAAAGNPDSTLAQLAHGHERNLAGIDQNTNAQNLYYSSAHANQIGDEATGYRQSQNAAAQSLAQLLSQANQGVLDASQHASDMWQSELPNAYQRALDLATLLGGDPTAGGGIGGDVSGGSGALTDPGSLQISGQPLQQAIAFMAARRRAINL